MQYTMCWCVSKEYCKEPGTLPFSIENLWFQKFINSQSCYHLYFKSKGRQNNSAEYYQMDNLNSESSTEKNILYTKWPLQLS